MIYDCSSSQSCDSASCSYFHTQHFLQPPIFPKNLTNLTDLTDFTILQTPYRQCAGTFRTSYNCATRTGAPIFFSCTLHRLLHRCVPPGLEIVVAAGLESFGAAGRPRARTRVSCVRIWVAGRQPGEFRGGDLEIRRCPILRTLGGGQAAGKLSQSVVEEFLGGGLARTRACRNHAFFQRFCQKSS